MTNQHDTHVEETDVFGFLGDMSRRLILAGDALRALAEAWHEGDSDEKQILIQQGADLAKYGRQLAALRQELCPACKVKTAIESLKFSSAKESPDAKNRSGL